MHILIIVLFICLADQDEKKAAKDNYSDDFEPDSQSLNKEADSKPADDNYSEDFEPDAQSLQKTERTGSPDRSRDDKSRDGKYEDDFESPSATPQPNEEAETKSVHTVNTDDGEKTSQDNDQTQQRQPRSKMGSRTQSYVSVEHAVQV